METAFAFLLGFWSVGGLYIMIRLTEALLIRRRKASEKGEEK